MMALGGLKTKKDKQICQVCLLQMFYWVQHS